MAIAEQANEILGSEAVPGRNHDHPEHVAHHFDSARQQFDACKLGMWLFLVTEVLFFSGLFVAYAVYRSNHPDVFINAHKYLNTTLGAFNTIVLLVSSLTMAWAVRSAQLEQKKLLVWLLGITLSCASLFLGVKAVEYSHKWGRRLLWARAYEATIAEPVSLEFASQANQALLVLSGPALAALAFSSVACVAMYLRKSRVGLGFCVWIVASSVTFFAGVGLGQVVEYYSHSGHTHKTQESGVSQVAAESHIQAGNHNASSSDLEEDAEAKRITGVFFSIYYVMTGVHAIHILCGMGVIAWLLWKAIRHDFNRHNFGPVDFTGLYWHLVDVVWIYLFPLLYLIR